MSSTLTKILPGPTQLQSSGACLDETERPMALNAIQIERRFSNGRGMGAVSLQVSQGEVLSIIGANGSGKTTLLRCLGLIEGLDRGLITLGNGKEISSASKPSKSYLAQIRGSYIGTVFQNAEPFPHLSVLDNLLLPLLKARKLLKSEATLIAEETMEKFGILERAKAMPHQLSGGIKQRVVLARALVLKPAILLLDEVTSALDPEWSDKVRRLILAFAHNGGAVIFISHRLNLVRNISNKVIYMDEGLVIEQGSPTEVLDVPKNDSLRRFLKNA